MEQVKIVIKIKQILKNFQNFNLYVLMLQMDTQKILVILLVNVRKKYPKKTIIAGNVVTADMTQELVSVELI